MNRTPARTFQDLIVWQKAHQFVLAVDRVTDKFPKPEFAGMTSQLDAYPSAILNSGF